MNELSKLSPEDEAARERLGSAAGDMVARTQAWSAINTGSYNIAGENARANPGRRVFGA